MTVICACCLIVLTPLMAHAGGFSRRPPEFVPSRERLFLAEMEARGLDVPEGYVTSETMPVYGRGTQTGRDTSTGLAAAQALLQHPAGRPTAIFCWRDEAAVETQEMDELYTFVSEKKRKPTS